MSKRPDDRRMRAWESFVAAHEAVFRRLEHELQERDLPIGWYGVLLQLSRAPEGQMRMRDLVGSILLTPSGLTRLADRMEGAGLIRRVACPTDRRGAFAAITPAGRSRLRRAAPVHLRGIASHFGDHLSDEDADLLADVLARVAAKAAPTGLEGPTLG